MCWLFCWLLMYLLKFWRLFLLLIVVWVRVVLWYSILMSRCFRLYGKKWRFMNSIGFMWLRLKSWVKLLGSCKSSFGRLGWILWRLLVGLISRVFLYGKLIRIFLFVFLLMRGIVKYLKWLFCRFGKIFFFLLKMKNKGVGWKLVFC